jgi:predicted dehydrogenase
MGVNSYDDAAEMLEQEKLDVASICTPPDSHLPLAAACLERDIHLLCEKPLAIDYDTTAQLIERARKSRARFFLATKFRHVPEIRRARAHILAGDIGDPLLFEIEFSSVVDMSQRWNSVPSLSGGGVIIDNGCHALDLVTYLFGGVSQIQATRLPSVQQLEAEDSALLVVSAAQGVKGHITLSWSMKSQRDVYLSVRGSRGSIEVGWRESFLHHGQDSDGSRVSLGRGYDKLAAHHRMMRTCRDAIAGLCPSWITHEESLATAAGIEAAYRSLRTGQLTEVLSGTPATTAEQIKASS